MQPSISYGVASVFSGIGSFEGASGAISAGGFSGAMGFSKTASGFPSAFSIGGSVIGSPSGGIADAPSGTVTGFSTGALALFFWVPKYTAVAFTATIRKINAITAIMLYKLIGFFFGELSSGRLVFSWVTSEFVSIVSSLKKIFLFVIAIVYQIESLMQAYVLHTKNIHMTLFIFIYTDKMRKDETVGNDNGSFFTFIEKCLF
jgi:hypothetical protein